MTQKVSGDMLESGAAAENLPATTKGDLLAHDGTSLARLPKGSAGQVLTVDDAEATSLKWAAAAGSGSIPVGMMAPFAGSSVPSGWLACDGSAVSRTTYSALYTTLGDAYGAGDGSTTFNLPDARGRGVLGSGTGSEAFEISGVDDTAETLTVPSNDALHTGQAVVYTSSGTEIGGLTSATTYYVIRVDATTVKLATTRANAVAGTAIDLTGAGSGTQVLTQTLTARSRGDQGGEERHSLTTSEIPSHTHLATNVNFSAGTGAGPGATAGQSGAAGGSGDHNVMNPYVVASWIIYAGT